MCWWEVCWEEDKKWNRESSRLMSSSMHNVAILLFKSCLRFVFTTGERLFLYTASFLYFPLNYFFCSFCPAFSFGKTVHHLHMYECYFPSGIFLCYHFILSLYILGSLLTFLLYINNLTNCYIKFAILSLQQTFKFGSCDSGIHAISSCLSSNLSFLRV